MKFLLSLFALLVFNIAHASTDLYIESVSYKYQGTTGYLHTNICNQGTTPNDTPRAHIRIMREGVWNVTEIQEIGKLSAQQCYNMKVNYGLPKNGTYQVAVLLDPKEQLPDTDRSNNYVTADFVTTDNTTTKSNAVVTATSFIGEFTQYRTAPISAATRTQIENNIEAAAEEPVVSTRTRTQTPGVFPDTIDGTLEDTAAAYLKNKKIINGYPDGEFKGDNSVNRAEVAKFLLLAREILVPPIKIYRQKFSDVIEGQWYVPYIVQAQLRGILDGYPDGTFRPGTTVNTVEFLKLITKTFFLDEYLAHNFTDVEPGAWYAPYVGVAAEYDLFPDRGNQLLPSQDLTRKDVAIAIFKILEATKLEE